MEILWSTYAFLVGACVGSFLNVCISRWPAGGSVLRPRSRCPNCGRPIAAIENVPIVSWLVLRARCRGCGAGISVQYPLVEIGTGVIWLSAYLLLGLSFAAFNLAVFASVLLGIAVTDARHYLIPDGFTAFGVAWILAASVAAVFLGDSEPFAEPYAALIGACAGAGAIAIAGWMGELVLKKEAMGFGDVTLMAFIGGAVGPERALLTIFLGALIGAFVFLLIVYPVAWARSRRTEQEFDPPLIPFGVFLAPAGLIALLWGNAMVSTYVDRFVQ